MDHVAVDLARFLGSLELPADLRAEFLSGFESVRPLNEIDRSLIAVLEPTGVVAALIGWMRKLAGGLHPTNEINQRIEFLIHKLKATSR
jgi:Ser/Thr protein kinase RdoA (MazF antagonist)